MAEQNFTPEELENETWKPVVGYEGIYSVSILGRVRRDRPGTGTRVGKILKPSRNVYGYHVYGLCKYPESARTYRGHQLVMFAFLGPPTNGLQINHIDGKKTNNRLSNLEYVTPHQNHLHAAALGLLPKGPSHYTKLHPEKLAICSGANHYMRRKPECIRRGEQIHFAKLTSEQVKQIRQLLENSISGKLIAKQMNISPSTVSLIKRNKIWRHIQLHSTL